MADERDQFDEIDEGLDAQRLIDGIIKTKGQDWVDRVLGDSSVDSDDPMAVLEELTRVMAEERAKPPPEDEGPPFIEYQVDYRLAASYNDSKSVRTPAVIVEMVFRYSSLEKNEEEPHYTAATEMLRQAKSTIEDYYRTDLSKEGIDGWDFDEGFEKPVATGMRFEQGTEVEFVKAELKWESRYSDGRLKRSTESINVIGSGADRDAFVSRGGKRTKPILPVSERGDVSIVTGEPL